MSIKMILEQETPRGIRDGQIQGRALLLCLFLIFAVPVSGRADLSAQVKGALLVSFTNLVTWTAPPASFTIGVVGDDPFGADLENVAKLKNVTIKKFADAGSVAGVDILYVNPAQNANLPQIVAGAKPGMLIVGEGDAFTTGGGMVAFVSRGGAIRFMLNDKAAGDKGLKFSPRLSSLAVAN